jgi:hypothetical protein
MVQGARIRAVNCRIAKAKATLNKEKNLHQQIGHKIKEETGEVLHLKHDCVWR